MSDELNNIDKKEPAFPRSYVADGHNGMTLRDYFAGQMVIGMHSNSMCDDWSPETMAISAYRYADAMLVERKK